jgi:hypothetical protein
MRSPRVSLSKEAMLTAACKMKLIILLKILLMHMYLNLLDILEDNEEVLVEIH